MLQYPWLKVFSPCSPCSPSLELYQLQVLDLIAIDSPTVFQSSAVWQQAISGSAQREARPGLNAPEEWSGSTRLRRNQRPAGPWEAASSSEGTTPDPRADMRPYRTTCEKQAARCDRSPSTVPDRCRQRTRCATAGRGPSGYMNPVACGRWVTVTLKRQSSISSSQRTRSILFRPALDVGSS
jgi:hypothetical protein